MKKFLIFKDEKSDKFWSIDVKGNEYTVTFGKTGTTGQSKTKKFKDKKECLKEAEKLISEKISKGYTDKKGSKNKKEAVKDKKTSNKKSSKKSEKGNIINDFIKKYLKPEKSIITEKTEAFEKSLNIQLEDKVKKFLSAVENSKHGINLREWSLQKNDISDFRPKKGKNLAENVILIDQGNYLGTQLLEVFTNSAYLGSLGNGDNYFLHIASSDGKKHKKGETEIVFFNHEIFDFEFPFSDSLETFLEINDLFETMDTPKISDKELGAAVKKLKNRANLSWHFDDLCEQSGVTPEYESDQFARYFMFRALWVVYLLRSDGVTTLKDMKEIFNLVDRKIENHDEFIGKFTDKSPVSACYWLWYYFFFGKTDCLKKLIARFDTHPSPFIKDTVSLILDFENGRKEIGKIKDIHELRKEFIALDLDPDREAERAAEEEKAKKEIENKKGESLKFADEIIKSSKIEELPTVAWKYIDNKEIVDAIFAHLRENDPSLGRDFARYDYLKENRASRGNSYYDFEVNEVKAALLFDDTRISPYLFVNGYSVISPDIVPVLKNKIKGKLEDIPKQFLTIMTYMAVPELEDSLISLLPSPIEKDDIIENSDIIDSLKILCPILGKMKSKKCIPLLISHADALKELSKSKSSDTAARARMYLYEKVAPLLMKTFGEIGDKSSVPFLNSWLDTEVSNTATLALIEIGDENIVSVLEKSVKNISGVPEKTVMKKLLLAYAKARAGKSSETESAKLTLQMQSAEKGGSKSLHKMAIFVLSKLGNPEEDKKLITPFIDYETVEVRDLAIQTLRAWGENIKPVYMDMGNVNFIYEKEGRGALEKLLKSDSAIFKYNIIRKLSEVNDTDGMEDTFTDAVKVLTRFKYYTLGYRSECFRSADYAIYALAFMKKKKTDDFVHSLMGHPNVIYRENDLFKYKNYKHSEYLAELMKTPPAIEKALSDEERSAGKIKINPISGGKWSLGCAVHGISYNVDGKSIAVVGGGKSVVFDEKGSEKFVLNEGGWAYDAHHSPDGKLIAVGFHGGYLYVFDSATGKKTIELEGHGGVPNGVRKVKFSPDGKMIASVSNDRTLIVWDIKTQKMIQRFSFRSDANTVDWFPDMKRLVVGTDTTIEIVDLDNAEAKRKTIKIESVAEVQVKEVGGKICILTDGGRAIRFLDEKLKETRKFEQNGVCRIRLSSDGKFLYASSWESKDCGVSAWDMKSGKRKVLPEAKGLSLFGMDINPSSGEIAVGGKNNEVVRFSPDNKFIGSAVVSHNAEINGILYDPKTEKLYTAGEDRTIIEWDRDFNGKIIFAEKSVSLLESLAFSFDRKKLLAGANGKIAEINLSDYSFKIHETAGRCREIIQTDAKNTYAAIGDGIYHVEKKKMSEEINDSVHNMAFIKKDNVFVTSPFLRKDMHVYDAKSLKITSNFDAPVEGTHGLYDFVLNNSETVLYSSGADAVIRGHDVTNWEIVREIYARNSSDAIAVSPSDGLIAAGSDSMLTVYSAADGTIKARGKLSDKISYIAFLSEKVIIVGGKGGKVFRCEIE